MKDASREAARVVSRGLDGSWILDALTIAMHSDDLKWRDVWISFIVCLLRVMSKKLCLIYKNISYLTLFLDKLACSSKEQSLPPNLGHKHVAVQAVSNIVHDCSLFPEGSV